MRKLLACAMLLASTTFANAQVTITDFWLDYENGTSDSAVVTWTCPDSVEVFAHWDTLAGFPNAWNALDAVTFGPGPHTFGFVTDSLFPDMENFMRVTVRSWNSTQTRPISIQTTSIAQIGNLRGEVLSQTSVRLLCDFMDHGFETAIMFFDENDMYLGTRTQLRAPYIGTTSLTVPQLANDTMEYYAVCANVMNPVTFDTTWIIFPVVTPPYFAQHPNVDSVTNIVAASSSIDGVVHVSSDSLPATVFMLHSADNFATSQSIAPAFIPPGYTGIAFTMPHTYPPLTNVILRFVIQNAFGPNNLWYDTLDYVVTTPGPTLPPENLVPQTDYVNYTGAYADMSVHPFYLVNAPTGTLAMFAAESNDTSLAYTSSWTVTSAPGDTMRTNTFYANVYECWKFLTLLSDGTELRQSYFYQREVCFVPTSIEDAPVAGWPGSSVDFNFEKDLATGYAWPILSVTDIHGRNVMIGSPGVRVSSTEELNSIVPANMIVLVTTMPDKKSGIVKTGKYLFVKME